MQEYPRYTRTETIEEPQATTINSRLSRSSRSESLATVLGGGTTTEEPFDVKTRNKPAVTKPSAASTSSSSSHSATKGHGGNSGFLVTSRVHKYEPVVRRPSSPPSSAATPSLTPNHSGSSSRQSYPPSPSPPRQLLTSTLPHQNHLRNNDPSTQAKTTRTLSSSIDSQGRRMVNQYVRLKTIGQGSHGKVWLCTEPNDRSNHEKSSGEADASLDDQEEIVKYCAVKSVAREPPGRGKSLRHAKGKKNVEALNGIGNDDQVKREVAIMKQLDHRNVVRLKEVIDDVKSKKVFMVLEFMAGGQIEWQDDQKNPTMTVDEARSTFRDVVLGLEYLHYQGIIHRDIKPANLLWTEDHKLVKISDFGVSHVSDALDRATPGGGSGADDKALRKTAGSPAFFAPELCHSADTTSTPDPSKVDNYFSSDDHIVRPQLSAITAIHQPNTFPVIISPPNPDSTSSQHHRPPIGKGIDVWALGITLYCLLFGDTPFMARTEYELYNVIVRESIEIPERMGRERAWTGVGKGWLGCGDGVEGCEVVNLLSGLLEKDPAKRISLEEVKKHPWVLRNLTSPESWLNDTNPTQTATVIVTEDEVNHATQEREAIDLQPRVQPSIRRALNTALQRFPAFSRKKLVLEDRLDGLDDTHFRSKRGSSESQSLNTSEGIQSGRPSRHPSDATNSKRGSVHARSPSSSTEKEAVTLEHQSTSIWGLGKNRSGEETGLSRAASAASSQRPSSNMPLHHRLLASRKRSQQTIGTSTASAPPPTRTASPIPSSDTDSITKGPYRLSTLLSRLGSRLRKKSPGSTSDDEISSAHSNTIPTNSLQVYASRRSSLPLVGGYASGAEGEMSASTPKSKSKPKLNEDEEESEFEYSSDEDDEFSHGPIDHADGRGWHSHLEGFSYDQECRRDGSDDAQDSLKSSPFFNNETTPRGLTFIQPLQHALNSSDHFGLSRPTSAKTKSWNGSGGRDGSIRSGIESSDVTRKWHVYSSNEGEEEDDDDVDEIFFAGRKRRGV